MAEKLFYSMGEVSEMFDVNPSLLRYWGQQFEQLRPRRNAKGNRMYSPSDILLLKRIYHFVKERGMTLRGAKLALRAEAAAERSGSVALVEGEGGMSVECAKQSNMELYERLQMLRTMLCEMRELLGEEGTTLDEPLASAEHFYSADTVADTVADTAAAVDTAAAAPKVPKPKAASKGEKEPARPLFVEQTLFG